MKIRIDEGHGGAQPGACAQGYKEKDLTLQIGNALAAELTRCGFAVNRTRTTDVDIGLSTRASRANQWGADYFVSIHLNAGGGQGAETWCSITGGQSKTLAQCINTQLVGLGYKDRGVKSRKGSDGRDYLAVIRETNMPAVLAEVGFIDSAVDMALFDAGKAAAAIAKGICNHTGIAYKQAATVPQYTAPAITGLTLDTRSKDMATGDKYTLLAKCKDKPVISDIVGRDVIKVLRVYLDPKGRGWLIDVEGLPPEPVARHGHIKVTADGVTQQCNFNVK
ncbi:N-acetylmuramoyl-L-alanine amidase family protein [Clostridium minihomine]|uniref:N-acetylmuramoyl-L-alanine amidase family protein n=1 Tax=Clostridium minihomine TaxID=2045012 RepID=UPI000C77B944|nr:N-acetylmuramoyl-L-alanine amidase [Clostridium minihomine]